jgi:hypothetical protein
MAGRMARKTGIIASMVKPLRIKNMNTSWE